MFNQVKTVSVKKLNTSTFCFCQMESDSGHGVKP